MKKKMVVLMCCIASVYIFTGCGENKKCKVCGGTGYYEKKTCVFCDGTGEYNPDKDPYESYKGMYDE